MQPLPAGLPQRLQQQLTFLLEIDRLKSVLRQSRLIHEDRRENSAEHSWHLAMLALLLAEPQLDRDDRERGLHAPHCCRHSR